MNDSLYDVQINEFDNKFIATIPAMSLIVESDTIEKAYHEILLQKEQYIKSVGPLVIPESADNSTQNFFSEFKLFFIKSLIKTIISGFFIILLAITAGIFFKQGTKLVKDTYSDKKSKLLMKGANETTKLEHFKKNLNSAKPYIKEFQKLLNE